MGLPQSFSSASSPDYRKVTPLTPQQSTPECIEAEARLLGILLSFPDIAPTVLEILPDSSAFYILKHQLIYQAIHQVMHLKMTPDVLVVMATLRNTKKLDKVGENYLLDLCNQAVSNVQAIDYANLISEKWLRRRLMVVGEEIVQLAGEPKSIDEILEQAEALIYALSQPGIQNTHSRPESLAEIMPRNWAIFEGNSTPAIPTGLLDIDALIGGYFAGDLMVVAGRPGMAKTHLAIFLAVELAKRQVPVHLFSLEMGKEQVVNRAVAALTGINSASLRQGRLGDGDWQKIISATAQIEALPFTISDDRKLTPVKMRSILRSLPVKPTVVFLDYLQLMGEGGENRVSELDTITRELRNMAQEFGICMVTLAQISRAVEQRQNKRPLMSDIRESGGIETHADVIATLYRDAYYNPDTLDLNIVEISIAKSRNGITGTAKVLANLATSQFFNLVKPNC